MASSDEAQKGPVSIDRRKLLQAIGATGAAGLAGCPSGDNSGDGGGSGGDGGSSGQVQDPEGERVPELTIHYWASVTNFQDVAPIAEAALDQLGVSASSSPSDLATNVGDIIDDKRTHDISLWLQPNGAGKADPPDLMDGFVIHFAGAGTANGNWANWANCEYTAKYIDTNFAQTKEEQTEHMMEGLSIMSESGAMIPVIANTTFGALRTDRVDHQGTGVGLDLDLNPEFYITSSPTQGDTIRASIDISSVGKRDFTATTTGGFIWGSHLVNSGLVSFDRNFNLVPELAEDWSVENEGTTYEFVLRDGAEYHNGDPVTAEDVKWTYEFYNETIGRSTMRNQAPYADNDIEVVDERTIRFNLEKPFLTFLNKKLYRWGVLHPPTWQAVRDDPQNAQPAEPMIGCGPFELSSFQAENSITFTPFDGHPLYSPDHSLAFQAYQDANTATQAFLAGELDVYGGLPAAGLEDVENMEGAEVVETRPFVPYYFMPQCSTPTGKFKAFRKAFAAAINRDQINQIVMRGRGEVVQHGSIYLDNHPQVDASQLPKLSEDPTGEVERARQMLADEGWQWDSNGNLHFPPDADTGPAWPKGERPSPDEFPCLNEDGSYNGPSLK